MSIALNEKLKLLRNSTGLGQEKFAELFGFAPSTYRKNEQGKTDIGLSTILTLTNHPEFKKYTLWLLTGDTNPSAGQYAPGDQLVESGTLSNEQFEEQAVEALAQSLLMFCHMGWFKPDDKKLDENLFDECGTISLNSIKPLISARYDNNANKTKTA